MTLRNSRWERGVLDAIRAELDPDALSGRRARCVEVVDPRVFEGSPDQHQGSARKQLDQALKSLESRARNESRLGATEPLIRRWRLDYDVYSPRLNRFIEVDEPQHFSRPRLEALRQPNSKRPLYPESFWSEVLPGLLKRPAVDRDPPHRDEARAYRDLARDTLPQLYGLEPTLRLDWASLRHGERSAVQLLRAMVRAE